MMTERLTLNPKAEDGFFQRKEKELIEKQRAIAAEESNEAYSSAHKNHCFRCGTHSLVEVDYKDVKIDICVNEGCGATHLDPGEMEKILESDGGVFVIVKNSVFSVFK